MLTRFGCVMMATLGLASAQGTPKSHPIVVPDAVTSALTIGIGKATKSRLVNCPRSLNTQKATCLYSKQASQLVQQQIASGLGQSNWPTNSQSLMIGKQNRHLITVTSLGGNESLILLTAIPKPVGIVSGEPYALQSDLIGVAKVTTLGNGQYRLAVAGQDPVTFTAGSTTAQSSTGSVQLALTPVYDGKHLLFPLNNLKLLGCTLKEQKVITVSCGSESIGIRPIYF